MVDDCAVLPFLEILKLYFLWLSCQKGTLSITVLNLIKTNKKQKHKSAANLKLQRFKIYHHESPISPDQTCWNDLFGIS